MGRIKVSDMIKSDIKVSKTGEVTGSINFISGEDVPEEGHWFPTELSKENYGKPLHVGGRVSGSDFTAGKDFTPNEKDPYLVICVEHCTDGNAVSVYDKDTKAELFKLDFNSATLEPPTGEDAVVLNVKEDFGGYGKRSEFYDTVPKIKWNGIIGEVSGTFKWFNGNSDTVPKLKTPGNYYPLVLTDFFKGKEVTVNDKTAQEFEWIVRIDEKKKITIKYKGKNVAVLDFSGSRLKKN